MVVFVKTAEEKHDISIGSGLGCIFYQLFLGTCLREILSGAHAVVGIRCAADIASFVDDLSLVADSSQDAFERGDLVFYFQ